MSPLARAQRDEEALRVTKNLLAVMPKIDLHNHLAGNVPEWLFAETARRYGIKLANPEHPFSFIAGMPDFLRLFEQIADSFRTPEDLYRASYESIVDEYKKSNLRYREVHYSPTINSHLDYADSMAAIAEGIEHAKRDYGVDGRIIVAIYRSQGPDVAEKLVAEMAAHPNPAVVGLGIEADEIVGPLPLFDRAYAMARGSGYRLTAHVGERDNLAEVLYAVDTLKVDRLDHAYVLATDAAATQHVIDSGLHIASAWVSVIAHHGRGPGSPFRTMLDSGLDASISSDDPGINNVSLNDSLLDAALDIELPDSYLVSQNYSQLDAAWIDEPTRSSIRADIDDALLTLAPSIAPTHKEE